MSEQLTEIAVDADVPVPPSRGAARQTYPFYSMAVGQSFFVQVIAPVDQMRGALAKKQSVLHSCASACQKRTGYKFTTRRWTNPDGARGIRVWRTE